jgi:hypothetical protein
MLALHEVSEHAVAIETDSISLEEVDPLLQSLFEYLQDADPTVSLTGICTLRCGNNDELLFYQGDSLTYRDSNLVLRATYGTSVTASVDEPFAVYTSLDTLLTTQGWTKGVLEDLRGADAGGPQGESFVWFNPTDPPEATRVFRYSYVHGHAEDKGVWHELFDPEYAPDTTLATLYVETINLNWFAVGR